MNRDDHQLLSPTLRADAPADDTVARMLEGADGPHELSERIAAINREIVRWESNGMLATWQPSSDLDPRAGAALKDYLARCPVLPEWADHAKIARAEALFMDMSMLSCTLLFCASLPNATCCPTCRRCCTRPASSKPTPTTGCARPPP